jgi:hypothetical protein
VAEIGPWLAKTYGTLSSVITAYGAYPQGRRSPGTAGSPSRPDSQVSTAIDAGGMRPSQLPGGPVAVTVHIGPYEQMAPAYEALAPDSSDDKAELPRHPVFQLIPARPPCQP